MFGQPYTRHTAYTYTPTRSYRSPYIFAILHPTFALCSICILQLDYMRSYNQHHPLRFYLLSPFSQPHSLFILSVAYTEICYIYVVMATIQNLRVGGVRVDGWLYTEPTMFPFSYRSTQSTLAWQRCVCGDGLVSFASSIFLAFFLCSDMVASPSA